MLGGVGERRGRNEPDDFAFQHVDAVTRGFAADGFEDAEDRRLLVVGQVHRDLDDSAVLERDAHRLHDTGSRRS